MNFLKTFTEEISGIIWAINLWTNYSCYISHEIFGQRLQQILLLEEYEKKPLKWLHKSLWFLWSI